MSAAPTVAISATSATASRLNSTPGVFTFTRSGDLSGAVSVSYSLGGTVTSGSDYQLLPTSASPTSVVFAPGVSSATLTIGALSTTNFVGPHTVTLTLAANASYILGNPSIASISVGGNTVPVNSLALDNNGAALHWNSIPNKNYRIGYKNNLSDSAWIVSGNVTATGLNSLWNDPGARTSRQRFYLVAQVD